MAPIGSIQICLLLFFDPGTQLAGNEKIYIMQWRRAGTSADAAGRPRVHGIWRQTVLPTADGKN